jgi:hypothetical protein
VPAVMALPPFAPATTRVDLRQRRQALPLSRRSRHREHSLSARTPTFSPDARPTPRSMHRCNRRPRPCWMRPTAPDLAARLIPDKSSSRLSRPVSRSTTPCSRSGHRRSSFHRAWSPGQFARWGGSRLRRQVRPPPPAASTKLASPRPFHLRVARTPHVLRGPSRQPSVRLAGSMSRASIQYW